MGNWLSSADPQPRPGPAGRTRSYHYYERSEDLDDGERSRAQADHLRNRADDTADKMRQAFRVGGDGQAAHHSVSLMSTLLLIVQESQEAWRRGDKALAKQLSDQGKRHKVCKIK